MQLLCYCSKYLLFVLLLNCYITFVAIHQFLCLLHKTRDKYHPETNGRMINMKIFILNLLIVYAFCKEIYNNTDAKSKTMINRKACLFNDTQPLNRVNTTNRLAALRKIMKMQALLITTDDEHQTEFVSDYDKRLQYISGFSGSTANAIITMDKAAVWTDSRYHLQADNELDCNWILMKVGNAHVPSKEEWLKLQFPHGAEIGADPKLISADIWNNLEYTLKKINKNFTLVKTNANVIDTIWVGHNETSTLSEGFTMDEIYTGKNWSEKENETRQKLKALRADAMVVTALDEIAWLLNVRGYDIPYSHLLKAYVTLTKNETILYTDPVKVAGNISTYFKVYAIKTNCTLKFKNYEDIWIDLANYSQVWKKILIPSAYVYSPGASKKIYDIVPKEKIIFKPSPIIDLKAKKNPTEILGMERAHIRDSAAMCRFLQHFESHFNSNEIWDEFKVTELVNKYRSEEDLFMNVSFSTIVAFAANGALPHYQAAFNASARIFSNNTLVIDSGGQYYDGTTDVTRTLHMGIPTQEQKQAYTRVLVGTIELSSLIFPNSLNTANIDALTRAPLWEIGYDYPHGTGHGIGASLTVHESPISIYYKSKKPQNFKPGYFLSNEPGFYQEGKFGVRLENIMEVIQKPLLKYQHGHIFLGFKDVTLVPYAMKLVDLSLLTKKHIKWLNEYNARIRSLVGVELKRKNAIEAFDWMTENTKYIAQDVS